MNEGLAWFLPNKSPMFLQRVIVAVVLLPIGLAVLFLGQIPFAVFMIGIAEIAVWEYIRLFRIGGYHLAEGLLYGGVFAIFISAALWGNAAGILSFIILSMLIVGWHLWQFQKGREKTMQDMPVSLIGIFLLGFLGSHFVVLRSLPGGVWWEVVVLTSVMLADVGAYIFGSWLGKNLIAPRISPKKTWEGYLAGILVAVGGSPLLLLAYQALNFPVDEAITLGNVTLLGVVMGLLSIMGDLLISLFKRYFGEKDTGKLLPGHGGILDRIDNWIWAVALGYYLISVIILS